MNQKDLLKVWQPIAEKLSYEFKKKDIAVKTNISLVEKMLSGLPETILVDDDSLEENVVIAGSSNLFSSFERTLNSKQERISFHFYLIGATVYKDWYNGEILCQGSWIECLCYIVFAISAVPEKIEKITPDNWEVIKKLINELKKE